MPSSSSHKQNNRKVVLQYKYVKPYVQLLQWGISVPVVATGGKKKKKKEKEKQIPFTPFVFSIYNPPTKEKLDMSEMHLLATTVHDSFS